MILRRFMKHANDLLDDIQNPTFTPEMGIYPMMLEQGQLTSLFETEVAIAISAMFDEGMLINRVVELPCFCISTLYYLRKFITWSNEVLPTVRKSARLPLSAAIFCILFFAQAMYVERRFSFSATVAMFSKTRIR
ncbi:MAG: hypothetical protein ACI9N9_001169 [Enterobacterales bacterium]|jgi:hypothetical protein